MKIGVRRLIGWSILCWVVLCLPDVRAEAPITAAAFTCEGDRVILGSQAGVEVRSWPDLDRVLLLSVDTSLAHVHDLRFSPDGQTLLIAGGAPAEQGVVEHLSWPEGVRLHRITSHEDLVCRTAWSPDGSRWVSAGADGLCRVHAADSGEQITVYSGHSSAVLAVSYLPDGRTILSVGVDQTLQVWDSDTGHRLRSLDHHVGTVNDVAVRPLNETQTPVIAATVSEDRTVRLWQPAIGRLMRFTRLAVVPRTLIWSEDGQRLLVGCNDGHVRVLDFETLETLDEIEGLPGRIHELILNRIEQDLLVTGETGMRRITLPGW